MASTPPPPPPPAAMAGESKQPRRVKSLFDGKLHIPNLFSSSHVIAPEESLAVLGVQRFERVEGVKGVEDVERRRVRYQPRDERAIGTGVVSGNQELMDLFATTPPKKGGMPKVAAEEHQPKKVKRKEVCYRLEIHTDDGPDYDAAEKECKQIIVEDQGIILDDRAYLGGFLFALPSGKKSPLVTGDETKGGGYITVTRHDPKHPYKPQQQILPSKNSRGAERKYEMQRQGNKLRAVEQQKTATAGPSSREPELTGGITTAPPDSPPADSDEPPDSEDMGFWQILLEGATDSSVIPPSPSPPPVPTRCRPRLQLDDSASSTPRPLSPLESIPTMATTPLGRFPVREVMIPPRKGRPHAQQSRTGENATTPQAPPPNWPLSGTRKQSTAPADSPTASREENKPFRFEPNDPPIAQALAPADTLTTPRAEYWGMPDADTGPVWPRRVDSFEKERTQNWVQRQAAKRDRRLAEAEEARHRAAIESTKRSVGKEGAKPIIGTESTEPVAGAASAEQVSSAENVKQVTSAENTKQTTTSQGIEQATSTDITKQSTDIESPLPSPSAVSAYPNSPAADSPYREFESGFGGMYRDGMNDLAIWMAAGCPMGKDDDDENEQPEQLEKPEQPQKREKDKMD